MNWFKRRMRLFRTVNELNKLSDRDLSDIGIRRSQIEQIARRTLEY